MSSKLLRPQNELTGKSVGPKDQGLHAAWAGADGSRDYIAKVSKIERTSQGATRRDGNPSPVKRMDPGVMKGAGHVIYDGGAMGSKHRTLRAKADPPGRVKTAR